MATPTTQQKDLKTPTLIQSIVLGGAACVFTVNFTHPIELVRSFRDTDHV
jgi:hypothetical protein